MAAVVHHPGQDSIFAARPTMDFSRDLDLSLSFDQPNPGLPTPAPTHRNSHGSPGASSPSRQPRHSPLADAPLPNPYAQPRGEPEPFQPAFGEPFEPAPAPDDLAPALDSPDPTTPVSPFHTAPASPARHASPSPTRRKSKSKSKSKSRSPPPANPDAQRALNESPTSYAVDAKATKYMLGLMDPAVANEHAATSNGYRATSNGYPAAAVAANDYPGATGTTTTATNEYAEGQRLFPPSPASSLPRQQTIDTLVDPEPMPMSMPMAAPAAGSPPEQGGGGGRRPSWDGGRRPSWDGRSWLRDARAEPAPPKRTPPEPDAGAGGGAEVWPEPGVRARAEVRVSGSTRAQAQQPTVVAAPPVTQQVQQQQAPLEEVCLECAMRDEDMADVDVTGPGVWARESDVAFEELLARERAEEAAGVVSDDPRRQRARGGRLTEANIRLWLSLNPKEPASKRANLEMYVRSQHALLEAETLARARAMQESRQLDDRMRDTYSALRRSTADLALVDGNTGVRLEHTAHGRDVTLLENGLIVESVDVRREERARRREEKRVRGRSRKSSRGSFADGASVYSLGAPAAFYPDGINGSGSNGALAARSPSSRPMSVLTAPIMGDSMSSQSIIGPGGLLPASRSTMSVEAPGNRRTRFFGMRNLSQGFRSSDSLAAHSGFSGSMVDMHLALHHDRRAPRPSSLWQNTSQTLEPQRAAETFFDDGGDKPKKKKKGLAKIWGLVTGKGARSPTSAAGAPDAQTRSLDREEDYPLAPPPPMSYLANRSSTRDGPGGAPRQASTPSLPSFVQPVPSASPGAGVVSAHVIGSSSTGISPPSAPSSALPSPTSARAPDGVHVRRGSGANTHESEMISTLSAGYALPPPVLKPVGEESAPPPMRALGPGLAHMTSEPDMRARLPPDTSDAPPVPRMPATLSAVGRPHSWRDKSLPPLPGEMGVGGADGRPRTLFGYYDHQQGEGGELGYNYGAAPASTSTEGFRAEAGRRQSFSGLASYARGQPQTQMQPQPYAEVGVQREPPTPTAGAKRKSKFGFGALLGRTRGGSTDHERQHAQHPQQQQHQQQQYFSSSGSEARHEALVGVQTARMGSPTGHGLTSPTAHSFASANSYAHSHGNGFATPTAHAFPRMSMSLASKKNIEAFVEQAPDFVAYRYPSAAPLATPTHSYAAR